MAVKIRHGANGSYKSATAVWFDLLPALRQGRVVVTNIQGMESVETIEKRLGERFPPSAKIIKIYSLTESGRYMWQNFYNWMPMGAYMIIDECQDIYSKTVGFDMAKNTYQGLDKFKEGLPDWYPDFYNRVLEAYKPDESTIDIDDSGETLFDDNGLIRLPPTFEESISRHRHFNWDITFVTPNIKKLSAEVRSCAEVAIHHKSKDSFFLTKRKPRLYEHDPNATSFNSPKPEDCKRVKVPLAVHLLYKSTVTGKTTKSGLASSPLSNMKFVLVMLLGLCSIIYVIYGAIDAYQRYSDDSTQVSQANQTTNQTSQTNEQVLPMDKTDSSIRDVQINDVSDSRILSESGEPFFNNRSVNSVPELWPFDVTHVYVGGISLKVTDTKVIPTIVFKQTMSDGSESYVYNYMLEKMGFEFKVLDYCLVEMNTAGVRKFLTCDMRKTPNDFVEPGGNAITGLANSMQPNKSREDLPNMDALLPI